jgi:hypothetical protein
MPRGNSEGQEVAANASACGHRHRAWHPDHHQQHAAEEARGDLAGLAEVGAGISAMRRETVRRAPVISSASRFSPSIGI